MHKKIYRLAVSAGLLAAISACASPATVAPASGTAASSNTITAVKVDAVALDIAADYWANAPKTTLPTKATEEGKPDGPDLQIQAAYDSESVSFRLEWADPTQTITANPWSWDGEKFTRQSVHEDRMAFLFPIENSATFSSKGCAGTCHNQDADAEKWWMGTENADEHLDLWQWKAAQTNPVGITDDQWLNVLEDPEDIESATHPDAQSGGGNLSNVNIDKSGPIYMNGSDVTASFIISGEQVAIDTSKLISGSIIPGAVLSPFLGSRGDVQATGEWQDGKWVVVLVRALDTGNEDDVVLTPPKSYPFGVAVFDHLDLREHTVTPDVLTLVWQ